MKGRSASFRTTNLILCACGCGGLKADRDSAGRLSSLYIAGHRLMPNEKSNRYRRRFVLNKQKKPKIIVNKDEKSG